MKPPRPPSIPPAAPAASKLVIRSEVVAVIHHLVGMVKPSRQERLKQLKRLQVLNAPQQVQDILVKELQRCASPQTLPVLIEFLMELGDIGYLKDKLWSVIRDERTTDDVKDAANLILRHLGDSSDPNLYLEYLEDPQGLIGRETNRMLEISTENPEALVDFIDFILSLAESDQIQILTSLQKDYPDVYLVRLYIPMLLSDPSPALWTQLIETLAQIRLPQAAHALARVAAWPEERLPVSPKLIDKALKQLQLAGVYHPDRVKPDDLEPSENHALVKSTEPYQCFVTLFDGIGNQGVIFSRKRPNGDVTMMSVAVNDTHGIIDCFGFYELSDSDFHKICEKFHEEATKVKVTPEYCADKLLRSEALNRALSFRLPYEYTCWRVLLEDIHPVSADKFYTGQDWIKPEWATETDNLYQHPDFNSWFLEQGDEAAVTRHLNQVILYTEDVMMQPQDGLDDFIIQMETLADNLMLELLDTYWRQLMQARLTETAYLLHCQNSHTFRNLAATEAQKLASSASSADMLEGLMRLYGRRCIAEELLRLRSDNVNADRLTPIVDAVMDRWAL